ncbi:hypothetical protein EJ02DRAFT_387029 [Clathrospora elynae]|uniref:Mg2+ transporter protein n=1 Tax=Clathrospora elynae TaxID=706981 RepID=A0A6A5SAU3_9PLEO|nr:hypothetical protein EJ02DRAFT_387029 [Clathrospora elynae]
MQDDVFSTGKQLAPELSQHFQIPGHLLSSAYRRSNGFFTFEESFDQDGHLQTYKTWFRVLVKAVSPNPPGYSWHEMTFCSRWDPQRCIVLCIGVDLAFQHLLQQALSHMWPRLPPSEPLSLHVPLVQAILELHDLSVWCIRDVIRTIEKDRPLSTLGFQDFSIMHETARHAIHSFETLSVSLDTVEVMQQQAIDLSTKDKRGGGGHADASDQTRMHLDSQLRMLRGLFLRSQSNKERLQNEISLAYNLIAQRDSHVMKGLGEAARLDSGALKMIAVVTMAFLPPTFLSAIFSMSFFNFTPGNDGTKAAWSVSDKFWVYWVCAVPLTCLTMAIWYWRQNRSGN